MILGTDHLQLFKVERERQCLWLSRASQRPNIIQHLLHVPQTQLQAGELQFMLRDQILVEDHLRRLHSTGQALYILVAIVALVRPEDLRGVLRSQATQNRIATAPGPLLQSIISLLLRRYLELGIEAHLRNGVL